MKVFDLLENNDWDNNQEDTLEYLFKKQKSASHLFQIELKRNTFNSDHTNWSVIPYYDISLDDGYTKTGLGMAFGLRKRYENYPTVLKRWNEMLAAKQKYEDAGGKYESK